MKIQNILIQQTFSKAEPKKEHHNEPHNCQFNFEDQQSQIRFPVVSAKCACGGIRVGADVQMAKQKMVENYISVIQHRKFYKKYITFSLQFSYFVITFALKHTVLFYCTLCSHKGDLIFFLWCINPKYLKMSPHIFGLHFFLTRFFTMHSRIFHNYNSKTLFTGVNPTLRYQKCGVL